MARKLLIVDDTADLRAFMVRVFRFCGFEVSEAESGFAALALLADGLIPDVVLLDQMMPGMTGVEMLRAMRNDARTARVPAVMFSAWGDPRVVAAALAEGASAYWVKGDLDVEQMVCELNRIIDAGPQAVPAPVTRMQAAETPAAPGASAPKDAKVARRTAR